MAAPCMLSRSRLTNCFSLSNVVIFISAFHLVGIANGYQANSGEGFLLCRKCGHEVASSTDLLMLPSSMALRQRNDSMVDKHQLFIQLFKNPHGKFFELITTSTATVERANDKHAADTWFPGYVWNLIFCPRCGYHLGWWFDAMTEQLDSLQFKVTSFVGFILEHVLHEEEESNLIAVPKSYMS